jgi:hypothetical protein
MASRVVARRFFTTTTRRFQEAHQKAELKKETRQNPELLVRHNASAGPDSAPAGRTARP